MTYHETYKGYRLFRVNTGGIIRWVAKKCDKCFSNDIKSELKRKIDEQHEQ